ncbi:hypothetical protein TBLA_0G02380 [Henningerozyma blattae CBS 6284]|uniref:HTH APSES-type domain-containing protein n=1 Tax=Henningerozyma blattae (strain ATCC 34711 / CBS 6284 / DSM 70876 / NBRC 10599 / NRRL Y-10934 / UCD 77-7) TaxID=1071380 RepID=I2H726_HENB6|nr:hypothetical protein TBLA_0G02380 [Tetrapisispora blattae CBS 6284]CCH62178.1 hypothetical protein TBLA_0G02380 [Tetrapisispora blattae CBS 6284]
MLYALCSRRTARVVRLELGRPGKSLPIQRRAVYKRAPCLAPPHRTRQSSYALCYFIFIFSIFYFLFSIFNFNFQFKSFFSLRYTIHSYIMPRNTSPRTRAPARGPANISSNRNPALDPEDRHPGKDPTTRYPRYPVTRHPATCPRLSDSPLDDFQRLCYATGGPGPDPIPVSYHSAAAEQFLHPAYLGNVTSATPELPPGTKPHTIECFEFRLPDISATPNAPSAGLLKAAVHRNPEGPPKTSENTVSKNQQFKLAKLNHSLHSEEHFINPNNCVIWDRNSGHVFLTGIWRLYQDVMNALVTLDRDGMDSSSAQDICARELTHVLEKTFYDPSLAVEDPPRKRTKRADSLPSSSSSSSSASYSPTSTAKYTDFHWNLIPHELKDTLVDGYRAFLCRQYPEHAEELRHVPFASLLQRIRGGYIKIQGTWLPYEVSRQICTRFCFPIRHLLVPLFGPQFPAACEACLRSHGSRSSIPTSTSISNAAPHLTLHSSVPAKKLVKKRPRHTSLPQTPPHAPPSNVAPPLATSPIAISPQQQLPPLSSLVSLPADDQPTLHTLCTLASFYTTRGHRYSYPAGLTAHGPSGTTHGLEPNSHYSPQPPFTQALANYSYGPLKSNTTINTTNTASLDTSSSIAPTTATATLSRSPSHSYLTPPHSSPALLTPPRLSPTTNVTPPLLSPSYMSPTRLSPAAHLSPAHVPSSPPSRFGMKFIDSNHFTSYTHTH